MRTPGRRGGAVLAGLAALALGMGGRAVANVESGPEECLPAASAASATSCSGLVELTVRDVVPLDAAGTHAVVLMTRDKERVIPIFVERGAAVSIAFRLAHRMAPQPLNQDLLEEVLVRLGARVTSVRIDDVHEQVFLSRVFVQQGKKRLELDARPSDALGLALKGGVRIFAPANVVRDAGIRREDIERLQHGGMPQGQLGVGGSGPGPGPHPMTSEPAKPSEPAREISL